VNEAENRDVALRFLGHLSAGEIEAALDLTADDVVWWLAGEPGQFAIAGTKNKAQLAEMLATIGKGMPTGIRLTVTGVTAEGDRVAVEMDADGISATGREKRANTNPVTTARPSKLTTDSNATNMFVANPTGTTLP